ncbi:Site-specific DNA recombinase [Arthrobacter alpinus]|uniref:Site-specific DNA recombinase n=1 Tax=Arthrobacter alpinus TaxID=656366 RepID=A0A1H5EBN0_9MICC|nr:recombinase family protein [Arthrobacter alpinus]SED88501.1 Site-specific DNA recombinase [Arthrobacter alpinus]
MTSSQAHSPGDPVAIYLRISSDRTGDGEGVARQLVDCERLAKQRGLNVIKVIRENDVSAYNGKRRKGFEVLKLMIEEGKIMGVVAYDSDRIYRAVSDLEALLKIIEEHAVTGFTMYSVTAGKIDFNTPQGRMTARLFATVAQYEVDHKAQRQVSAHEAIFARGGWSGGRLPLGYQLGERVGEIEPDPVSAPVIQHIAAEMITGRMTITAATKYLRENTRHKFTKPVALKGALRGPTLYGLREYIPAKVRRKNEKAKTPIKVPGTLKKAAWEPILDTDDRAKLMIILKEIPRGRPLSRSLLAGLMQCGLCGTLMGYSKTTYKCNFSTGGCAKISVSTTGVEKHVMAEVNKFLAVHSSPLNGIQYAGKPPVSAPTRRDVASELTAIAEKRKQYMSLEAEGLFGNDGGVELRRLLKQLKAQEEEINFLVVGEINAEIKAEREAEAHRVWASIAKDQSQEALAMKNQTIRNVTSSIKVMPSAKGTSSGPKFEGSRVKITFGQIVEEEDFVVDQRLVDLNTPSDENFLQMARDNAERHGSKY